MVALLPPLLALASSLGLAPTGVFFIAVVGLDYCLTLPVSSKALLVFHGAGAATWTSGDLLKLNLVLAPLYFALVLAFYLLYWRWVGLAL